MHAILRRLHSPDIDNLPDYSPPEPDRFSFLLQIIVGPETGPGEESFDVVVCTPKWLLNAYSHDDIVVGRHMLIVFNYDYARLVKFIDSKVVEATGAKWDSVAHQLCRLGRWEFEDYSSPG
jgi:Immunity protein 8